MQKQRWTCNSWKKKSLMASINFHVWKAWQWARSRETLGNHLQFHSHIQRLARKSTQISQNCWFIVSSTSKRRLNKKWTRCKKCFPYLRLKLISISHMEQSKSSIVITLNFKSKEKQSFLKLTYWAITSMITGEASNFWRTFTLKVIIGSWKQT